eukprot:6177294-Pleurochrysis_carterae.AAC.2
MAAEKSSAVTPSSGSSQIAARKVSGHIIKKRSAHWRGSSSLVTMTPPAGSRLSGYLAGVSRYSADNCYAVWKTFCVALTGRRAAIASSSITSAAESRQPRQPRLSIACTDTRARAPNTATTEWEMRAGAAERASLERLRAASNQVACFCGLGVNATSVWYIACSVIDESGARLLCLLRIPDADDDQDALGDAPVDRYLQTHAT